MSQDETMEAAPWPKKDWSKARFRHLDAALLQELAAIHRPPQSWFDEPEDNPLEPQSEKPK